MNKHLTFVFAALIGAAPALAQLGGAAGVVIPYSGKLELNGALSTGSFDFQFQIMPDATTTTPCDTSRVDAVAVTNGEFALTIPAVPATCVAGRDVHLIVSVRSAGIGAFTTLGKQRVTPVLGALTSGTGDFNIARSVGVGGNASIAGSLSAGSVSTGSVGTTNMTTRNATVDTGILIINPVDGTFPWSIFGEGNGRLVFSTFGVLGRRVSFGGGEGGSIRAQGSISANSTPDIAETIGAASNVEGADVVCADPAKPEHVVRCAPGAHGVLGVISDGTSAFLINSRAQVLDGPLTGQPLVLAGRVPVKVSTENGPIHIGDELALSSTPGVAMRASGPGPVVGIALAPFDGKGDGSGDGKGDARKTGTVLCFVKVQEGNVSALEKQVADLQARLKGLESANRQAAR